VPTKPRLVTAATTTSEPNFESKADSEHSSNMAIIIPTAIVAAWLILLFLIALVVCCRKRRSQRRFATMYGPVRPLSGGYAMRKSSSKLDGSYEDHLEKAARLSSELSSYNNQNNGRVSLYGSYWNISGSSDRNYSDPNSRQSFAGFPSTHQPLQRYSYHGRY